ncbi:L-fucose permease [Porphyromonas macacae]|uniref:L-fucose permease n=1 Tax=Porphyromonas macacae TaxID=28115 RepID=A0A379DIE6_9PORP|nr:hypothetical protein [Porphyromonas macacae]SUB77734.1 L-fucose permease [Porphyromonas macacae]
MNGVKQQQPNYLVPFIIMVVLMSLIGLITNLNQQFQGPMQAAYLLMGGSWTNTLTVLLTFSFFLAYLIMGPSTSRYIDKNGYKKSLIFGLIILIAAFGLFELSAYVFDKFDLPNFQASIDEAKSILALKGDGTVSDIEAMKSLAATTGNFQVELTGKTQEFKSLLYLKDITIPFAYYIFLFAAFVAGTALTYLQAVVNPYLVACDVTGTSPVQRQSIAGTGNSAMTTVGPLIVAYLIFSGKEGLDINITSLYIPILVLIVLTGIIIFVLKGIHLPNIAAAEKKGNEVLEKSVWSFSHLALGVVAIFVYVGVEVAVGANINLYAIDQGFMLKVAAKMATLYWGGLLVGRFISSFLSRVGANIQLIIASIGAGILVLIAMITNNPWVLVGVGLFHSIMWPAIFSLAIDKLGKYTSKGTGVLMMGVVGGAVLPLLQGLTADMMGWQWTWIIVVAGEAYLLYYAMAGYKVKQLP